MKHKAKLLLAALLSLFGLSAFLTESQSINVPLPSFITAVLDQDQKDITVTSDKTDLTEFDGQHAVVKVNHNDPSFTEEEKSLTDGSWQTFSDLDSLNRVGVAEAMLHKSMMPNTDREDISEVYPTGWKQKKLEDGTWLYNRSHLLGFQLTGENANWLNLFTGTQELNQVHMVEIENEIADYLRTTGNHVRYRVTPLFQDQELLARAVQIEAESIEDDQIKMNVVIYNVQSDVTIDYQTGKATVK